jgi:tetratricopeptide (TPR) repeat protein
VSLDLTPLEGRLELRGLLGEGGMGEVHRAWDAHLERAVAVKLLRGRDGRDAERVLLEARLQARVEHPHVVRVHEVGALGGRPCIVFQLVEGRTLARLGPELELRAKVELVRQAAAGLQAAHLQGLVHRDVKPSNVLVEEGPGGVRAALLTDFGLARGEEAGLSRTGLPPGTLDFMSPEQLTGSGPADFRSDVYALGATLYAVVAGRPPFRSASGPRGSDEEMRILRRILEEDPEPLWRAAPGVPRDLALVAARAMEKDPAARYPSAEAFGEDLSRWLRGEPIRARRAAPAEQMLRWAHRNRALARVLAAAAVALVLSLAGGYAATYRQWRRAEAEHREAEQRFDDIRRLAGSLLFEVHDAIARLPGSTRARELIVKRAVEYLDRLYTSSVDDGVKAELAEAYLRLARVQGRLGLGDTRAAVESCRRAVALAEPLATAPGAAVSRRQLLARAERLLAEVLADVGEGVEAEAAAARSVSGLEALVAAEPRNTGVLRELAAARWVAATGRVEAADWSGAWQEYRRAADLYRQLAAAEPGKPVHRANLALALRNLAGVSLKLGRTGEARSFAEEAVALDRARTEADPEDAGARADLAISIASVAEADEVAGRIEASLAGYREALGIHRELAHADPANSFAHVQCAIDLGHVAGLLARRGRGAEAVAQQRLGIAEWEAAAPSGNVRWSLELSRALAALGDLLAGAAPAKGGPGADAESCRAWRRSLQIASGLRPKLRGEDLGWEGRLGPRLARCGQAGLPGGPLAGAAPKAGARLPGSGSP